MKSPAMTRRDFLSGTATLVGLTALACDRPVVLTDVASTPPAKPAPAVRNVRDFGARADGVTNDVAAFARAIASLPAVGGTVHVPDGVYATDPTQSIQLTAGVTLAMSRGAMLAALPTAATHSAVISISGVRDVRVTGGRIVGERNTHLGTKGEWGMGIRVLSAALVSIEDVQISDCWGDGIYVGGMPLSSEVTIRRCQCRNNRRQGLSITGCITALVEACEFTGTNGTAPESGIDLEPNAGQSVTGVTIRNCVSSGNNGLGIELYGTSVTLVTLDHNVCANNKRHGIDLMGATGCFVHGNRVEGSGMQGLHLQRGASSNLIVGNTIRENGGGANLLVEGSNENTIQENDFGLDVGRGAAFDIVIGTGSRANALRRNAFRVRQAGYGGLNDLGVGTVVG